MAESRASMYFTFSPAWLMDWVQEHNLAVPVPLSWSKFGRTSLLAGEGPAGFVLPEAQATMAAFAAVLRRPSYAVYAQRVTESGDALYAAMTSLDGDAVTFVDDGSDQVSIALVERSNVADSLAEAMPALNPAQVEPVRISGFRFQQVNRQINEGASDQRVAQQLAVDDPVGDVTEWWLASRRRAPGGWITGMQYSSDEYDMPVNAIPFASWIELSGQALLQVPHRNGGVMFEPYSSAALTRAIQPILVAITTQLRGR